MEAETNSPEDASSVSVPLVKSIKNIGNEEIIFPQKLGNDVNSKYLLVEEKGKADSKTDEVFEIRPQEMHQESSEVCVGSEKQAEVPLNWLKQRDSEGLVMRESIPKSSIEEQGKVPGEHEHEPMSTIPELAINHSGMAEKICEEETYNEEEESTEMDYDKSCRPENELGQRSKALEAIDQTQFTGKDTAVNEHADHHSEVPSMENVITKHSISEEKLPAESSIKSNYEEEPLEKILELYSVDNSEIKIDGKVMPEKAIDINKATEVELKIYKTKSVPADGTLKTLSTTECIGAEELENKNEGKFTHEKAKEMEAATEMQLLESATADSPPENKDQPAVSTSEFVKGHTDEISQQQTHKNDETSVIDTEKSRAEPEGAEKLDKEAKAIEEAIKTQLLNTETERLLPEEEVQPRLPTPDIVQQDTDQIIKQQPLNQDQPDLVDNAKSCIEEKELDRLSTVIEESVQLETKGNISIVKEQADQQSEETSMQSVTTNYMVEGHVTSESSTKLTDDVHESHSIKNLEKKDANEIKDEATDVKISIRKTEAKGMSEDKALQTLFSAELVGSKTVERCQEDIKPEAQLAVTYANEEQTQQHEFNTKKAIPEEEACQLTAENEPKSEPQIVAQNNETTCIKHLYLDGETAEINPTNDTVEQEITMSYTKEKLDNKKINLEEVQRTVKETKLQLQDTTTESVSKEEPIQPIARAELVRTEAHDESSPEEIQPEANVTEKSNKEVQTSHVTEKEGIWGDNGKCSQVEEAKTIEEPTKMQLQEEEVQTRSPNPASVQGDTNQIWQQEALYIDESEVNDNAKQGCIPKIAQDIKLTIAQETEKEETKDNVGILTEKLDNKDASDIRLQEGTDAKKLTDMEIPKSETEGVSKDEAQQPITNTVLVGTEVVDEGSHEVKESEAGVEVLSNKEEQRPEYVTEGTVEINTTSYTNENEEVPTCPVSEKEGIENDRNLSKEEESKGVEEETKMQKQKSPTPSFVKGDTNQKPQQETLYINSEVFDNAKQWCIPPIELDKKTTVVQETSNPETKDKVRIVAENLDHKDATEFKAEEGTYAQQSTDVETLKSEREGMPIDEAQQPIANAVSVGSEALDESSQEEIPPQAYVKEKPNIEVQTPEYVTEEVVEINTTKYTEKEEVPKSQVKEREKIADKFNQEKVEGIEEATKMQLLEEEVQIRSCTLASVQGDTNQMPQQETLRANESEVIQNATIVQETEVSERKDNAIRLIENSDKDASEITAEEGIDAKQLTHLEMTKSETEEGIQDDRKFNRREKEKRIEEVTEMQTPHKEVHTTSPTPAFVKSHTDKTQQQKAFHLNESNVIATAKQSCIPEFEHDRYSAAVQGIEVFETKHNVDRVMENSDKEETKIRENEKTEAKQLKESSQQDKQLKADITVKSNKKVKTPEYVTEEKDKNPTDHANEKEGIKDILNREEKAKLIEETTKTHSEEEEVQTRSHPHVFVKGDTNQIPHQETMHVDESEVIDNAKLSYIQEIELDGEAIVVQETEVSKSLYKKDATEIRVKKEIDAKKLTDSEMPKSETEGVPEDEAMQPISNAVLVRTEAVEQSKQDTQPKADVTDKSNREVLIKKFVTEETAEINTNNYTEEQDTVQTSHAKEQEGTMDDEKLHEEEAKGIEEKTKTQLPEEEFQTSSPIPAFIQGDTGQTSQQDTVNIDESEVLDNDKQSCIPDELDEKSTVVQETNNPETKDNVSTGEENLDNKDAIEVRADEGTYVKQLTNVEIPKSETKGVPKGEPLQPIANIVLFRTETVEEGTQQGIQPQADVKQKSNKDVKTPEYVTTETIEKNTTNYNKEQEKVPSNPAEEEGIKNKFNHKEEAKGIEEATKIQSLEEEFQTKSPTPIFIQGDNNQVPYQETLPVDGSEVIDNAKQSCIPEIELDGNSIVVQETEKPETKNNVNIITRNFDDKDASEIRAEEESYDKQVTELERSKSLTEDVPENEYPTPIAIAVVVGAETVNDSNQEQIPLEDGTEKKSKKGEQTPKYVAEDTPQIKTNDYPDEHDKDQTSHAKVKEGIDDEENSVQMEKTQAIAESSKMHLPHEEDQTTSPTPAFVQGNTEQISQHELRHVDESEVIDYVKSCIPEIELERKSTTTQETEKPETKDNISKVKENLGTTDATKIRAEEETDSKTLADFKTHKSEIEDQVRQPIAIAVAVVTDTVDNTKEEQIQLEEDVREKQPTEEKQSPPHVTEDTAEINTTSYTDQHDKVQTSDAEVKQGIEDDENFGPQEEAKAIAESSKMWLPKEEVQTISPTPAFVQVDTEQISQQELLYVDESEVIDYVKQSCIPEIELERKSTIAQETEETETKDNIRKVTENLGTTDASKIRAEEETDSKTSADFKKHKSKFKEDQVRQPIAIAVAVVTDTVDDTKEEQIQLEEDIREKKPTEEEQTTQNIAEDAAKINTTSYTDQHDKVQTPDAEVKQGIEDAENFGPQEEAKDMAESRKMQLPKEEVQTILPTSAFVQVDTEQISQQELLYVDESEVIDYVKQSCIPEIELERKSSIAQESEKPKIKDNISKVAENLATTDASKIRAQEEKDSKTSADFKKQNSEFKDDQIHQSIAIAVAVVTETVDESKEEHIQLEEDITEEKSNKEEQTPHYATEDTSEINTTSYTDQHDKVQTSDAEVKHGIEDDENFGPLEECKAIAESSKIQLPKEEVQTTSPSAAFVLGDSEQFSQQELLQADESEVIDYVKQSCIPEIEVERKSTIVQETEKPETKDNISKVTGNLDTTDASKIRGEEETDSKTLADFKMQKSEIKEIVPEDEVRKSIAIAVAVVTKTVDDSKQELIQLEEDITEEKSIKEEQTPQYIAEDTAEVNTTSYYYEHDKLQTSNPEIKGSEDDERFGQQQEAKTIAETNKTQFPKEEVQTRSPSPEFFQHHTDKIWQQELLQLDQSEVTDYVKQSCIPEIELDRKCTIAQETEKPETKDNISNVTDNLSTNYGSKIRAEEETDFKKLADLEMPKSEIAEDELLKPITIGVVLGTKTVDDSNQEQIHLEEDITEKKSNIEEQTPQYVDEDTAGINTNNYTDEHDKVQTSDAEVKERIEDDEKFGQQEEAKGIKETSKIKLLEKEVQTRSPTTAFVQGSTDQILQQELLHVDDESEVIDYMKQSSLQEIQLNRKSTVVQETEKPDTKDNVGIVTEKLGTTDACKIREEKGTDGKKVADLMIPKSEIEEDEVPQPIAVAAVFRTETVDDINEKQIQLKEEITEKKSNKEQSPQYVAEDTAEINTNSYTDEHDKVQTSHAKVNQGIEGFGQEEEASSLEERNKMKLPKEEVQITSPTPALVQGDTDQILQQELLHIDKSEVIDYVKQSSIPEIELDRKFTTVQETEKPETKNNVSIVIENLGTNDAREIGEKEETNAKNLADLKMAESEIEGVPKDETLKPRASAVLLGTKAVEKSSQQDIQLEGEVADKSIKEVHNQEYNNEESVEINVHNDAEEKDKNPTSNAEEKEWTSHAEEKEGIEDIFNQEEKEKVIEEATKTHSAEEEIQTRSPPPAFVKGDTNQIPHQETLHVNESEVIDNAKLSCIPEIELHEKAIVVQKTEKLETKDNFDGVTENLDKDESENRAEEGIDAKQLTDLEMPKSETEGVPEDESLEPIPDTVFVENEAVIVSQEKRQPQQEFIKKFNKEVQTPKYFTDDSAKIKTINDTEEQEDSAEIETTNDTEEQEEDPPCQPKEKSGIKDDGKFEEKGIEEATKTQLQDKDIRTTLPIHTLIQCDFDQILQIQTLRDDESKAIGNAKKSCTQEVELDRESSIVEEPETKDNVNIVKQEQAHNQSKTSSIQRAITHNITAEGLFTSESNREIGDDVRTDEQKTVKSSSRENLDNKNASKIRVEKSSEAQQSTYVEILESKSQGEPEDKALQTRSYSSSIGNEGLDESSPEERQTEAEFTENFNKDVQTPLRDTRVTAQTNSATYPDKQQEAPASHANEKLGIQDEGKFDQEEAEGIEESIEKQLPEEEIQYTLPTPTSVQGDIDKMSQQQTPHDDEIEAIDNGKSCMTEFELDRKSKVVEEPKPETKANVDLVKEEKAGHQSEESSEQSFITNYLIVERHVTSESNKELSDDIDLDGHKKVESHLVELLEIKDASEIRAKGIHTNQLTDIEIQKSETEGVAEDKGMQTMSSTTSVKNYASNECCQEEIQPREEYVETHIKEVKTPYYEFDMQKHTPEAFGVQEDACQITAKNEQKLKSQLAPPNKETTFVDNLYSDGEIAKTNPINDIDKEVNPKSRTMEKSMIHDDSKFNEVEAKGIEEMTKIKLLDTATDSPPEEVQSKLPAPATVQGDTDQILQHQILPGDASDTIDNDMRCIPENKLDRMSTVVEEPETKANINIVEEEQSDKQSQEPSMQSLITEYITAEGHLASESNSKLSYDMNEQKTVNLQVVENLGITYGSKMTAEEVTDAKQPTGVEVEKTKNEGVLDFKAKTLTNAELVENETLDETNQEEMQPEEEFSGTYSKGKQTPQSSMENVITKHINSEGKEITEISTKSSYDEEEQEQVINTYTIENSEIKDGRKIMLEEASDIKEATDEPVDRAISIISPISSVRIGIVDESIQEKIQKEVQPTVINTTEEQKPENDFVRNTEVLEEFDLKKVPGNTCVENEEKVEVQSEANNQKTIKKHPNLEKPETAEISPSDTKELGKESEVANLGGVSESISLDITEHIDMGKLETQEAENAISGNTKDDKAGDEFEKISPSSSVEVITRDSQDTGTKVLHKKSNSILSGVGSKVKHSISKVKKVITGKSSRPKTPPSSK